MIDQVGGNAVFVNNYNRRVMLRGCHIARAGGSGVAFLGDPGACRNPATWNKGNELANIDRTPGPRTNNYPADCLVDDCLIHDIGQIEKQGRRSLETVKSRPAGACRDPWNRTRASPSAEGMWLFAI